MSARFGRIEELEQMFDFRQHVVLAGQYIASLFRSDATAVQQSVGFMQG